MADVKLISMALTDRPGATGGDTADNITQVLASYPDYELFNSHASLAQGVWALLFVLVRKSPSKTRFTKDASA